MKKFRHHPGSPTPLGATPKKKSVNFAVFSSSAAEVILELYEKAESGRPLQSVPLVRTGDVWHAEVEGIGAGQYYAFRAEGAYEPEKGRRFNRAKLLLDPYARGLAGDFNWDSGLVWGYDRKSKKKDLSFDRRDSAPAMPKCVVVEDAFDWEDDRPPAVPWENTVIYEAHLRGFTMHPSSGDAAPGTFAAFEQKIPYLKELGITAVELLPIMEFDPYQHRRDEKADRIKNYWGYNTAAFFAPKRSYSAAGDSASAHTEFRSLVKALHRQGIEVILDIVFNHTPESDELGPTLSMRGLDNEAYYILDGGRNYANHSGCGNTVNANHPAVIRFKLDCLEYWAGAMHVDGFRFDLAGFFFRDSKGQYMPDPPILKETRAWAKKKGVKLIAEPWDAGGIYALGRYPPPWREWNGRFRDDSRLFWKGADNMAKHLATRIMGSSDLFTGERGPTGSVNFVTSHDGFTLADLVSYNDRHNEDNGEDNRDGEQNNHSMNCGVEGETNDAAVLGLRERMRKNLLATLLLSKGVPMITAGDEFGRTQKGNNNAYCQDNDISWLDWRLAENNAQFLGFVKGLLRLRKSVPRLGLMLPDSPDIENRVEWFNNELAFPDWNNPALHSIALWQYARHRGTAERRDSFFLVLNAGAVVVRQRLPQNRPGVFWRRAMDTNLDNRQTLAEPGTEVTVEGCCYYVQPQSMVLLIEK